MNTKKIAMQLLEMSFDFDYLDYADEIDEMINTIEKEISGIQGTPLYEVLEQVALLNGDNELTLITQMQNYKKRFD